MSENYGTVIFRVFVSDKEKSLCQTVLRVDP